MNALVVGFLILGLQITGCFALWGNLQMSFRPNPKANLNTICKRTQSVLQGNSDFCTSKPELVKTVMKGIAIAVNECQIKFASRKWNCSTVKRSIRRILQHDYRETAFVFAIASAGITYSVSKACSEGDLEGCYCRGKQVVGNSNSLITENAVLERRSLDQREFERKGCQASFVEFGYQIAKQFMDQGNNKDAKALVTRHNNEAGRLAVKNHMHKRCRCHGLSQVCTHKTCWNELASFYSTSDRIKTHFDGAIKVYADNKGESLMAEEPTVKPPTSEDLIYTTKSPNFCVREKETGTLGTKGRTCNVTSLGTGGCDLLCCDRGYESKNVVEYVNCECTFHWCCEVRCKTCRKERTVHTCL